MTKKSYKKMNDSALRVLEVLKMMINADYSKEELLDFISEHDNLESVHRAETLNKYFGTYKFLGAELSKIGEKHRIERLPLAITIDDLHLEMLVFLFAYARNICTGNDYLLMDKLAKNVKKYFTQETKTRMMEMEEVVLKKYHKYLRASVSKEEVDKYEKLCKDKLKLNIVYNNNSLNIVQSFIVEPKEIIISPVGCVLRAYNPSLSEIQDFCVSNIVEISQLPSMVSTTEPLHSVTFKLTGRLACSYELKEGERITEYDKGSSPYLVVTSTLEDKRALMKRLLRYGESCRVLYPTAFREEMIDELRRIKALYK